MEQFKGTTDDLGVWKYGNDLIITTPSGGHICRTSLSEHSDEWHEYVYANAHLLSAAPQMLKALQTVQLSLMDVDEFDMVRDAISKALGSRGVNHP